MAYQYKEMPLNNQGFRYYRDNLSILVQASGYSRRFTDAEMADFSSAVNRYLDDVQNVDSPFLGYRKALTEADFPDLTVQPLYKYVSESTWKYMSSGSFQLGTAAYFRNTPNMNIRDRREGASIFHLNYGKDKQLHVAIQSGFNCALFCGTIYLENAPHKLMLERFGKQRIKIEPLHDFISIIQKHLNVSTVKTYDVVYTDIKNFVSDYEDAKRFEEIVESKNPGVLDLKKHSKINQTFFEAFYGYGLWPGLFAKPAAYSDERERRIVFEFEQDLTRPVIVIEDKSLLDYVTPMA